MRCAGKEESISGLAHYSQFSAKLAGHGAGLNYKVDTTKLTPIAPGGGSADGSDGCLTGFFGPDAKRIFNGTDKHLSIPNLAGLGRLDNGFHCGSDHAVG
jgi:hypothetical protein